MKSNQGKRLIALWIIGLFLVSLLPLSVFADEDDSDVSVSGSAELEVNSGSDDDSEADDGDDDLEASEDDDLESETETETSSGSSKERMRTKERVKVALDSAGKNMSDRFASIREHQKVQLMVAIENCKEHSEDPQSCEERLKARLDLVARLTEKDLERVAKISERKTERAEELRELMGGKHYTKFHADFKARTVAKARLEAASEKLKEAREAFVKAKQDFAAEKKAFAELKAKLKDCGDDNETQACAEASAEITLKARAMIISSLDMMLEHLQKVRASVEESEHMTAEEAAEALEAIDAKIAELEALKAEAEAITAETSKETVQDLAKRVANAWKTSVKTEVEHRAGFVMASRMGGIVVKSERLGVKLEHMLEVAAEKGVDTAAVQASIDSFHTLVTEAQEQHAKAVTAFEAAADLTGEARNTKLKEANTALKAAQSKLKEAHKVLKDITAALRQKQLDVDDASAEAAVEAELEAE